MKSFDEYLQESGEIGQVESIFQSVIYVSGLPKARPNELVITEDGEKGLVQDIEKDLIEILILSSKRIIPGTRVTRTNDIVKVPVSTELLGRVVDPFLEPVDGLPPVGGYKVSLPLHRDAPGIRERVRVNEQLESGVSLVDFLIPLGKGQRELVIGDQKTGRTTFLLQTATSQVLKGAICIYVAIGKKKTDVKFVEDYFRKMGVMKRSVIIFTSSADPASLVFLAPFTGFTVAEFFRDQGNEVVIILDDLTTHAKFYREISLISKRMPSRESYPGDIFNVHAKLIERAGNFKKDHRSKSITAFPIIETVQGDLTGFLPTNVMAMTDGHLFFDHDEFKKGHRPAINTPLSVTRVGNQTQTLLEKEIRKTLADKLSRYRKALEIAHFGFDLPLQTRSDLNIGERLEAIFYQESDTLIPKPLALVIFGLLLNDFWVSKPIEQVRVEREKIVKAYNNSMLGDVVSKVLEASNLENLKYLVGQIQGNIENALYSSPPRKDGVAIENPNVKIQSSTI